MSKIYKRSEVAVHNKEEDCWVIIEDGVYDVTEFLGKHPGSFVPILQHAGKDASKPFFGKPHSKRAVEKLLPTFRVGSVDPNDPLVEEKKPQEPNPKPALQRRSDLILWTEFETHDSKESLWILVNGKVYDVTNFKGHPGSFEKLLQSTGKDATKEFEKVGHKAGAIKQMEQYFIGEIDKSTIIQEVEGPAIVQPDRFKFIAIMALVFGFFYSVGYFGA